LGALTDWVGGVVIVPLLTVVFHVDIHYAIVGGVGFGDCHFQRGPGCGNTFARDIRMCAWGCFLRSRLLWGRSWERR